ncbi:hypothetical protein BG262_02810 [Floricoccus penangensis]|uniref:Portal protein n=1 Tax=Floricoccus penangensis TaxID=1859475 RepID=A0A9Q5NZN9_9LACT|nr:hypothetical protein [Floricoccus penangensis]OFI46745.1 hypothetical protein BG262_02810 [Floricoccus penangensis]
MVRGKQCDICNKVNCHGECMNYLIEMVEQLSKESNMDEFNRIFMQIPDFNYRLDGKINAVFGTDLEVAKNGERDEELSNRWDEILYKTNRQGSTNLAEIKKFYRYKEVFGTSYLFIDDKEEQFRLVKPNLVSEMALKTDNDILGTEIVWYKLGSPEINDSYSLRKNQGFEYFPYSGGYAVAPSNIIKIHDDSFILNSDLLRLQILLSMLLKILCATTDRDYGDLFVFTEQPKEKLLSAVAKRTKDAVANAVESMRVKLAEFIKQNKTDDSNVVIFDEQYKDIKQIAPVTPIKDFQFIYDDLDNILSSVTNFPSILVDRGDIGRNVSNKNLLSSARAGWLTPQKKELAVAVTPAAKLLLNDKDCYLRFKDYPEDLTGTEEENTL